MATVYCPNCQKIQPTYEHLQGGEPVLRCTGCGFLVQAVAPTADAKPPHPDTVLCIDDDPLIRQLLTATLKATGFAPLTAADGPSGLALAAGEQPRLILVDLMMPGMDGYEVCRRLKADPRTASIPRIILTAAADPKLNARAFQAGADLALMKPIQPDRLMATLRAAMELKRSRE